MIRRGFLLLISGYFVFCLYSGDVYCKGNVILKSLIVNPSKTTTQRALLKAYLPKEATPDDIIDLGDLKIDYDIDKELYYVYKEVDLEPGESASRYVEIKDVWIIRKIDLDALVAKSKDDLQKLKETAYYNTAAGIVQAIEDKSMEILSDQDKALDALPQKHIAVYRENAAKMEMMKSLLASLDEMVLKLKLSGGSGGEVKRIFVKASWRVIMGVIIALGVFSFIFFLIWHKQAGLGEEKKEEPEQES